MKLHKKILLIDDDEMFVFFTKKSLEEYCPETEITVCQNGLLGLRFLTDCIQQIYDLPGIIFLDINMPVMDGWEFIEEFTQLKKNIPKEIPVIFISSSISPHDIEKALSYKPVKDYIIKPIGTEKLEEVCKKYF